MGGKQRLAATGRQSQADIRNGRQAVERSVGTRLADARLVGIVKGGLRSHGAGGLKIGFQNGERFFLVFFEGNNRHRDFKS